MSMNTKTFGEWLRNEREARRLSQAEVERRSGISHSHYSKMENNKIPRPVEETRAKLHAVFGTSDDDLVRAGILRPRSVRSASGGHVTTIYEYDDGDSPTPATVTQERTSIPSEIAELLDAISWTPDNVAAVKPLLEHIVRADARAASLPDASPDPSLPAVRTDDRARPKS